MTLHVTVDGETVTVEVTTAALSWAERCTGLSYSQMGEASLQLAAAFFTIVHGSQSAAVDWDVIHTWGVSHHVSTAL